VVDAPHCAHGQAPPPFRARHPRSSVRLPPTRALGARHCHAAPTAIATAALPPLVQGAPATYSSGRFCSPPSPCCRRGAERLQELWQGRRALVATKREGLSDTGQAAPVAFRLRHAFSTPWRQHARIKVFGTETKSCTNAYGSRPCGQSAARDALEDDQGHLPDCRQLLTTPAGLQKVTKWAIERGILGQYQRTRGFLYQLGPSSPANN
jgi:hypothetical protein